MVSFQREQDQLEKVQIEHKNILNHEVKLLVDEWNEML